MSNIGYLDPLGWRSSAADLAKAAEVSVPN